MVRVFKYHSFASQTVIQVEKEPLTICAEGDKVFVATSDCEIIVYHITNCNPKELHRFPTVCPVEKIIYNAFKNCVITIELKKSWKGSTTKSVRVYLNSEHSALAGATKQRAKVRVAGKSHIQHTSGSYAMEQVEIVEVPTDGNVSCIAACNYTGNFAIASGYEVKLCSIVEKTISNSDRTYLDVEVFLELCWNFTIISISLCEEYVVCCSHKEVQGICVKYDEGEKVTIKDPTKFFRTSSAGSNQGSSRVSSGNISPGSYASEIIMFSGTPEINGKQGDADDAHVHLNARDLSSVGMRPLGRTSPKPNSSYQFMRPGTKIVEDENYVEWNFHSGTGVNTTGSQGGGGGGGDGGNLVCLPGLHSNSMQSQCYHHMISPPVLSDFSGGKAKSISGVQAETVLHLNDTHGQEEWMSVTLIPSHCADLTAPLNIRKVPRTDRMRSTATAALRVSMCCYISGTRGGFLYQLWPQISQVSLYKYTDIACQVDVSESFLHIVTSSGIETYTSRWGAVCLETRDREQSVTDVARPPPSLDICLCGHQPFVGASCLSVGTDFLALLSKVEEDSKDKETHWALYVLHSYNLIDLYKDMLMFATRIEASSPSSYIDILQEAHLLLASHPLNTHISDPEVGACLREVSRLMADHYTLPDQSDWDLAWPYYHNCGACVEDVVNSAVAVAEKKTPQEFGKGLVDFLNHELFSQDEYIKIGPKICNTILDIYAVAAPESLSKVILLSHAKDYSPEHALRHLKTWLAVMASSGQIVSSLDKLALVQLNLLLCEVEAARQELRLISQSGLIEVCATHPSLVYDGLSSFTSLAQLMRQHMALVLLNTLVELLDRGVMSLDSLLILLKSQSPADSSHNTHVREVLELILTNKKRIFLFDEAVNLLCQAYIGKIKDKAQNFTYRQITSLAPQKFSLPHGDGHFAPRFSWLDDLPPFFGLERMMRPCQRIEVKVMTGGSAKARGATGILSRHQQIQADPRRNCPCCFCNESLLKLQSLLCSPRVSRELAESVLKQIDHIEDINIRAKVNFQDSPSISVSSDIEETYNFGNDSIGNFNCDEGSSHEYDPCTVKTRDDCKNSESSEGQGKAVEQNLKKGDGDEKKEKGKGWDSIRLLCLWKLDLHKSIDMVVEKYPSIAGSFGASCFNGDVEKFTQLMRSMESAMKSCATADSTKPSEETYVKAYKDLMSRLTELLTPEQLVKALPGDANLYFLLPYLCQCLERAHQDQLKSKIVEMGQELMKT